MGTRQAFLIDEPDQLDAIASMVRQEIMDTVQSLGRCSIRELAQALGRPADGLYYHVRMLVGVGLLEETSTGDETRLSTVTRGVLRLRYDPEDQENVESVGRIVGNMVRVAERDFKAGFRPELARCTGPRRNLNASRQKAWLNDAEVREVNTLLGRLQEIFRSGSAGEGRLHSLTFIMAPIASAGPRRGAPCQHE